MLKLFDYEWLCYIEDSIGNCEYWVIRRKGVSPLFTRHKVKKKNIVEAVTLFQNHPDGIKKLEPKELYEKGYKEGESWNPQTALDHYAETIDEQ